MIGKDDSAFTVEFKKHYEILPNLRIKEDKIKVGGKKLIIISITVQTIQA